MFDAFSELFFDESNEELFVIAVVFECITVEVLLESWNNRILRVTITPSHLLFDVFHNFLLFS